MFLLRIVLFIGMFDTLDLFVQGLIRGCEEKGFQQYLVDIRDESTYTSDEFMKFISCGNCIALTFNHVGYNICDSDTGENLWEKYSIPFYSWLVDHPRAFQSVYEEPISVMHMIVVDRDHLRFAKEWYPKVSDVMFIPHGGTELADSEVVSISEREIDVLYTGDCQPEILMPEISFLNDAESFYIGVIQTLLSQPWMTVEEAVNLVIHDVSDQLNLEQLRYLHFICGPQADCLVRREMKLQYMFALDRAGIHVDIVGREEEWRSSKYPLSSNIRFHGRKTPTECLEYMKRAKITLNIMPWFKDGSHERIFNSQLNHSVCITERNTFVDRYFDLDTNLLAFDAGDADGLVACVKRALEDVKYADSVAEAAYVRACRTDRWEGRIGDLLNRIELGAI